MQKPQAYMDNYTKILTTEVKKQVIEIEKQPIDVEKHALKQPVRSLAYNLILFWGAVVNLSQDLVDINWDWNKNKRTDRILSFTL